MRKTAFGIFICFLIPLQFGFAQAGEKPLKVALSKASPNYISWIGKGDPSIVVIDLSKMKPDEALLAMQGCSGLILTGGGDIDPSLYQDQGNREMCTDIDANRDLLEKAVTEKAMVMKMPILGICRGEQMLNVLAGGTLITDIPRYKITKEQKKNSSIDGTSTGMVAAVSTNLTPGKRDTSDVTHQCDDYLHCGHTVWLESSSLLRSITGADTGFVTTNHHQAVLAIGKGLKKNAVSGDGIIEGVEWKDPSGKSFLLGIQWHPERMDVSNAYSGKLLQRFVAEVKKYASTLQNGK
jgi:putative glutamine amidotransferase